jgi:hypothetical protein
MLQYLPPNCRVSTQTPTIARSLPNEKTEAIRTHHDLAREPKRRNELVAKAVESAHGYRFQDSILYLHDPNSRPKKADGFGS